MTWQRFCPGIDSLPIVQFTALVTFIYIFHILNPTVCLLISFTRCSVCSHPHCMLMSWNSLGQNQWKCLQNQSQLTPKSDPLCSQGWKRELEVRKCLCPAQSTCVGHQSSRRVLSAAQLRRVCRSTALTQRWAAPGLPAGSFSWLSWSSWSRCPWWWWGWSIPGAPGRRSFPRRSACGCRCHWQPCSQFRTRPPGSAVDCCSSWNAPRGSWPGCHPTWSAWRTASLQTKTRVRYAKSPAGMHFPRDVWESPTVSYYAPNNHEHSKETWSPEYL